VLWGARNKCGGAGAQPTDGGGQRRCIHARLEIGDLDTQRVHVDAAKRLLHTGKVVALLVQDEHHPVSIESEGFHLMRIPTQAIDNHHARRVVGDLRLVAAHKDGCCHVEMLRCTML
jgi:hypothetical protein